MTYNFPECKECSETISKIRHYQIVQAKDAEVARLREALGACRDHIASVCPGDDMDAHKCLDLADEILGGK